jgi:UDP-N-acetylmuramate--alanine ligase
MLNWRTLFSLPKQERNRHRIHLVGLGGTGLAPIAKVLLELGFQVSGSDREANVRTQALQKLGARAFAGHDAAQLLSDSAPQRPDLVLISSAVPQDNVEVQQARAWDIPVVKRHAILGPLTENRQVIAVSGTHGKTTTTAMIAHTLTQAGRQPGYIIGSEIPVLGFSAAGHEALFVIEADEYDYMFLGLHPWQLVITNLEWDHPDMFPTAQHYQDTFRQLLEQLQPQGQVIYCHNDRTLRAWQRQNLLPKSIGYGSFQGAEARAEDIDLGPDGARYQFIFQHERHQVQLQLPGVHNVLNSMAALLAVQAAGVPLPQAIQHLASFQGSARRFERKGEVKGVLIIDDYAHHPAEIRSTLQAARAAYPQRTIWAVYQPHTYSRTRTFLDQFNGAFNPADYLLITDIYPAREAPDPTITPELVAAASHHEQATAIKALEDVAEYLLQRLEPNSLVIILSAGTATRLGPMLLDALSDAA